MAPGACPQCGCRRFYVKDPEDSFETYNFEVSEGKIRFDDSQLSESPPEVGPETEAYCDCCSWHDRLKSLG